MPTDTVVEVRAAGGIVWRAGAAGACEVLVVHRPKYRDWSFPKGKQEPGETDEETALREVEEETGLVCQLGPELPGTAYVDRKGRTKEVRYWVMTVSELASEPTAATGGEFAPSDEVDEVRWLGVSLARAQLTYDRDRAVLDAFATAGE